MNISISKKLFYPAVEAIRKHKRAYKYLTYDSALLMLKYGNIQFTRADKLNDEYECDILKIDLSSIEHRCEALGFDKERSMSIFKAQQNRLFKPYGVCSLGTSHNNETLWNGYTKTQGNNNGICIELDTLALVKYLNSRKLGVVALPVEYVEDIEQVISYECLQGSGDDIHSFFMALLTTKDRERWGTEKELRFIMVRELLDEYERVEIPKECFKNIYLGWDISQHQLNEIMQVVNSSGYSVGVQRVRL